jgi:hypothetical protein
VGDAPGEDQTVASAGQGRGDVVGDQGVAFLVEGQPPVHLGQRAWRVQLDVAGLELGVVQEQHASRSGFGMHGGGEGSLFLVGHGVPHGTELPGDELPEAVAPGGGGGEAEPELRGDRLDGVLVGGGAEVMTLVDDDVPVIVGEGGDVVASGQRRKQRDVDGAGELAPAAAELAGLEAEELRDTHAPLVGEGFAVDEDQGRCTAFGDHGAAHDGLPGAGRGDKQPRTSCAMNCT